MLTNRKRRAFVIMPFHHEFRPIFDELIAPALQDAGYDVARADSFLDQQNILRDVITGLASADLVVAEITTLNANVLYELGLCHGLRVPTIMLTQSIDEVPFDLRAYRIVTYSLRFDQVGRLKDSLRDIAEKHASGLVNFGSPVTDFWPQTLVAAATVDNAPVETSADDDEEQLGWLDGMIEGQSAMEELNGIITTIGAQTIHIGERMQRHASDIQELTTLGAAPTTAVKAHKIALLTAIDMNSYVNEVGKVLPAFETSIGRFGESLEAVAVNYVPQTEEQVEQVATFRDNISEMLGGLRGALGAVQSFQTTAGSLKGISKEMTTAARRVSDVLGKIVNGLQTVEAVSVRASSVLDSYIQGFRTEH